MTSFPRKVYSIPHIDEASPDQQIVKCMSLKKFQDLITRSALYFRRIDHFPDTYEGKIPLALWDLEVPAIREWYNSCKEELFVNCWNLDEDETPEMWSVYAEGRGVRISSTVGTLVGELSHPPVATPTYDPAIVEMVERAKGVIADADPPPQDGFTLGRIRYMDFARVDVHSLMAEGPGNTVPAFRKRNGYVHEREFRAILRPGSISGMEAKGRGDVHVFVPVRLHGLIQEIRFAPVDDADLEKTIKAILTANGLTIPVQPAALGLKMA